MLRIEANGSVDKNGLLNIITQTPSYISAGKYSCVVELKEANPPPRKLNIKQINDKVSDDLNMSREYIYEC